MTDQARFLNHLEVFADTVCTPSQETRDPMDDLCHSCEVAPIRLMGPPATRIECLADQRLYCLPCLLDWNRRDQPDPDKEDA